MSRDFLHELESLEDVDLPSDEPALGPDELSLGEAEQAELEDLAALLRATSELELGEARHARGREQLLGQLDEWERRLASQKQAKSRFGWTPIWGVLGAAGALALAVLTLESTNRGEPPSELAHTALEESKSESAAKGGATSSLVQAQARVLSERLAGIDGSPRSRTAPGPTSLNRTSERGAFLHRAEEDYREQLLAQLEPPR